MRHNGCVFWRKKPQLLNGAAQTALGKLLEQRLNRSLKAHQKRDLRDTLEALESQERLDGEAHVTVVGSELAEVVTGASTRRDRRASEPVRS
jgi:hypothetical protein